MKPIELHITNNKKNPMTYLFKALPHSLFVLALMSSHVTAQSYFNTMFLDQMGSTHSHDLALAGSNTSEFTTVFNTFSNPANLGEAKGLQFSGSFSLISTNENRSYPAIDQFGDRVTDNIYVVSRGRQNVLSGGASWGNGSFGVAVATKPMQSSAFYFKEELRGSLFSPNINRDPLIGYHHINQQGVLQATGFNYGFSQGALAFGAGLKMLHGVGLENQFGVSVIDSSDTSPLASEVPLLKGEEWFLDRNPIIGSLGAVVDLNMHWRVSASYQTAYSLGSTREGAIPLYVATEDLPQIGWTSDTITVSIDLPARVEFGLRMKPSNPLPTSVYVSLAYQDWSSYDVTYSDTLGGEIEVFDFPMQEVFTISGGLEHWVSEKVPFRAGFSYAESPLAGELAKSRFSAGSGWVSGPLQFDVAVQLYSTQYSFIDIFAPSELTANPTENIRETQTLYSISVSYSK